MRNWIKKNIANWVNSNGLVAVKEVDHRPDQIPVLNFRIYSAVNGQILEFSKYDRKTDQHSNTVYIIEKDQNVGDYVAKCLSVELLK